MPNIKNTRNSQPYYDNYTVYLGNKRCDDICRQIPICEKKNFDDLNPTKNKKIIEGAYSNLNIGKYIFTAETLQSNNIINNNIEPDQIVISNIDNKLIGNSNFTYKDNTLKVSNIGSFKSVGAIDFNSQEMNNVNIKGGTISEVNIKDLIVDFKLTEEQKREIVK